MSYCNSKERSGYKNAYIQYIVWPYRKAFLIKLLHFWNSSAVYICQAAIQVHFRSIGWFFCLGICGGQGRNYICDFFNNLLVFYYFFTCYLSWASVWNLYIQSLMYKITASWNESSFQPYLIPNWYKGSSTNAQKDGNCLSVKRKLNFLKIRYMTARCSYLNWSLSDL